MNCFSCGNYLPEGAMFCPNCGLKQDAAQSAPAVESAVEPEVELAVEPAAEPAVEPAAAPVAEPAVELTAEPVAEPVVAPAAEPVAQPAPAVAPASVAVPVAQPQGQPAGAQVPPAGAYVPPAAQVPPMAAQAQPVYAQGCVAAAVADVKGDPLLTKNMLLMGLIGCVPILNFVVYGYAINWAREIPFGGRTRMPAKIVNGQNFEIGFYAFLISLVIGLILTVGSMVLGFIPLLGAIVILALSLGAAMFQYLLQMRVGMTQQLNEGFKVQAAWNVLQRNWTGLLCAVFVPSLVATGVILAVTLVAMLVIGGASIPMMLAGTSMASGVAAVGYGVVTAIVCLVICVACGICVAAATVVSFRAVGHWVARYAPEWAVEAQQQAYYSVPM